MLVALGALLGLVTPILTGCGSGAVRANPLDQTAKTVSSSTYGTSKFTRVEDQGSLNIDTNLPTYASLLDFKTVEVAGPDGKPVRVILPRVDSAGGGASHEMLLPLGKNQYSAIRSATVFGVRAAEYRSTPDGDITIKGLEISSDAASANRSVADVAQALAPTWAAWSADDRARFEAQVKAWRDVGVAGMDTLGKAIDLLKGVTAPGSTLLGGGK